MGFVMGALGPSDRAIIAKLQPEIVTTLRKASTAVRTGNQGAPALARQWFGDDSPVWMAQLSSSLNRMASIINTKDIAISFSGLKQRCGGEFAAATVPRGGWTDYTNEDSPLTASEGRNFTIHLNLSWNAAPTYCARGRPGDSKFQTLVHECTHLILDTDDDCYGVPMCEIAAATNPAVAKKTADNWGYFVEQFR